MKIFDTEAMKKDSVKVILVGIVIVQISLTAASLAIRPPAADYGPTIATHLEILNSHTTSLASQHQTIENVVKILQYENAYLKAMLSQNIVGEMMESLPEGAHDIRAYGGVGVIESGDALRVEITEEGIAVNGELLEPMVREDHPPHVLVPGDKPDPPLPPAERIFELKSGDAVIEIPANASPRSEDAGETM